MDNKEPTKEELAELARLEQLRKDYYISKVPFLKLWEEHDNLSANLSEHRLRKLKADLEYTRIMVDQENMKKESSENGGKPEI